MERELKFCPILKETCKGEECVAYHDAESLSTCWAFSKSLTVVKNVNHVGE